MHSPVGYLVTTVLAAFWTFFAVAPPRPRHSSPSNRSYWLGYLVNELPFVGHLLAGGLDRTRARRGRREAPGSAGARSPSRSSDEAALGRRGRGAGCVPGGRSRRALRQTLGGAGAALSTRRSPRVCAGVLLWRRSSSRLLRAAAGRGADRGHRVRRAGRWNLLDVYRHRSHPSDGPVLVYLHGGGFRSGRKSREARPLLYRLASQGWVCVSANYRLEPGRGSPIT